MPQGDQSGLVGGSVWANDLMRNAAHLHRNDVVMPVKDQHGFTRYEQTTKGGYLKNQGREEINPDDVWWDTPASLDPRKNKRRYREYMRDKAKWEKDNSHLPKKDLVEWNLQKSDERKAALEFNRDYNNFIQNAGNPAITAAFFAKYPGMQQRVAAPQGLQDFRQKIKAYEDAVKDYETGKLPFKDFEKLSQDLTGVAPYEAVHNKLVERHKHRELFEKRMQALGADPLEDAQPYVKDKEKRIEDLSPEQVRLAQEARGLPEVNAGLKDKFEAQAGANPLANMQAQLGNVGPEAFEGDRQRHMKSYERIFRGLDEEAGEKLKERLKNEIDPSFIASGMWRSGTRQSAHEKVAQEVQKDLERLKARMWSEGEDKALQAAREDRRDKMKIAEMQGNAGLQANMQKAQGVRDLAGYDEAAHRRKVQNQGIQQLHADQAHRMAQQTRDYDREERYNQKYHRQNTAAGLMNIAAGATQVGPREQHVMQALPHPGSMHTGVAAAVLGAVPAMANMGHQAGVGIDNYQQNYHRQNTLADGGHVEKFAGGGVAQQLVNNKLKKRFEPYADLFSNVPQEMGKPMPTDAQLPAMNTPEIGRMRQQAKELKQMRGADIWDYIGGVGAGMSASGSGKAADALLKGAAGGVNAYNAAQDRELAREDKITDLNKEIQNTRQLQMDRELHYRQQKDKMMFDRAKESATIGSENQRHAEKMGLDRAKLGFDEKKLAQEKELKLMELGGKKKFSEQDQKSLRAINFGRETAKNLETMVNQWEKEGKLSGEWGGNWARGLGEKLDTPSIERGFSNIEKTAIPVDDRQYFETQAKALVSATIQAHAGKQSKEDKLMFEQMHPHLSKTLPANKKIIADYKKMLDKQEDFIRSGKSDMRGGHHQEAPQQTMPSPQQAPEAPMQGGEMVEIVSRDGRRGQIPASQLAAAEQDGFKRAA